MQKILNKWQKITLLSVAALALGIGIFQANEGFKASITAPELSNPVTSNLDSYEVAIADYEAGANQNGAIKILSGKDQKDLLAVGFKIKYSPSELILKQVIDSVSDLDFLDIEVDNQNGVAEINLINSEEFKISSGEAFAKLELVTNKNLLAGDEISIQITDVELIDSSFKISQGKGNSSKIKITSESMVSASGLLALSAYTTSETTAVIEFNDYLTSTGFIEIRDCENGSESVAQISSIQKDGKKASFQILNLQEGEVCQLELRDFIGNTKLSLKESAAFISGFKSTGNSMTSVQSTLKNAFVVQFDGGSKTEIENPTNYQLIKGNSAIPTTSELISEISFNQNTKQAKFTTTKILDKGARYILIANLAEMSSNKILTFVTENTGEVELYSALPSTCPSTGCSLTVQGANLDNVQKFLVGENQVNLNSKTSESATLSFEKLATGIYDLVAIDKNGKRIILENSLTLTEEKIQEITIDSESSYASPARITNDGKMPTTLWTVVEGVRGVNDINRVTVDLRPIGGSPVAQMKRETVVDGKVWFSLEGVTAYPTTKTSNEEVRLEITAEDTNGLKAYGTISLFVTNDLVLSAAPVLSDASITYDKTTRQIEAFVKVSDEDGISDLQTVTVDLTTLGLGYQVLHSIDTVASETNTTSSDQDISNLLSRNEKKASIFRSESPVLIPADKKAGTYNLLFSAFDKSGEEGNLNYTFKHTSGTAPQFVRKNDDEDDGYDMDYVYIDRWSIPNDGATTFSISTTVRDEDGADDIVEVRADLSEINGDIVLLERQGAVVDGTSVKSSIFTLKDQTISETVLLGWRDLVLTAYDKQGNETSVSFEIKVTDTDESGKHLEVKSEKGYTEPPLAYSASGTVSLNVFVENNGKQIDSVVAYLENLARFTGTTLPSSSENCQNQTEKIVCLNPSVKEGNKGQWFVLPDVQVLPETKASTERYRIKIVAIDSSGRTSEGYSYLTVSDGTLPNYDNGSPKLQMAVSTDEEQVQLVFSNPLDPDLVQRNFFKIVSAEDTSDTLSIKDLSISSDATVVTLETDRQDAKKRYTVIANALKIGLKEDSYTDNHKEFFGYDKDQIPPQLLKVKPISPTKIALYFDQGIKPSTVEKNGNNFEIFERTDSTKTLEVLATEFADEDNKTLYLSTEEQEMNQEYLIVVKHLSSAAGVPVGGLERDQTRYARGAYYGITKEFTGFVDENLKASASKLSTFELSNSFEDDCVDFRDFTMFTQDYKNGKPSSKFFDYDFNNKIDFTDFTIFTAHYGKCREQVMTEDLEAAVQEKEEEEKLFENSVSNTGEKLDLNNVNEVEIKTEQETEQKKEEQSASAPSFPF